MYQASASCLRLLTQGVVPAFVLAFANAGSNIPARMAMMAITTSSSIRVKAKPLAGFAHICRTAGWVLIEEFLSCYVVRGESLYLCAAASMRSLDAQATNQLTG